MMNPLPFMGQTFSLLIQEEKQREFKPTGRVPTDLISLNTNVVGNKRIFRTNYQGNNYVVVVTVQVEISMAMVVVEML